MQGDSLLPLQIKHSYDGAPSLSLLKVKQRLPYFCVAMPFIVFWLCNNFFSEEIDSYKNLEIF